MTKEKRSLIVEDKLRVTFTYALVKKGSIENRRCQVGNSFPQKSPFFWRNVRE